MAYLIHLEKESFKFSGTHFTIFGPTSAERMHGHNYHVKVSVFAKEIQKDLGMPFDFNLIKPNIKKLCDELDEYILIAENSPYLQVQVNESHIITTFNTKTYHLPKEDVRLLPLVNTTAEELARYFYERLAQTETIANLMGQIELRVTVEETAGQAVTYFAD